VINKAVDLGNRVFLQPRYLFVFQRQVGSFYSCVKR
jgi:hypothetical protein